MDKKYFQVAIDGPAGSGKSTVALLLSKKLKCTFINSGGMFRCYALALNGIDLSDLSLVKKILKKTTIKQVGSAFFLNKKDVTKKCYDSENALVTSLVAKIPLVRERVLMDERKMAQNTNIVVEGRDTTSIVFPNATLKVYMTASIDTRAIRRYNESDKTKTLAQVKDELIIRDEMDTKRKNAPLVRVKDAFYIETDELNNEEVAEKIINELYKRF